MQNETLTVKIMSPREVLFDGLALAVSSENSQGKFDIIPQHANFITIVEKNPIVILKPDKTQQSFTFAQAIIYHVKNQVTIYADPQSMSAK